MKSAMFPFILGLGGFILFVSIELLYQLSEVIVSYKVPIWRLFELLYYNIPMFTVMGIPVGVLLAIFWILSQMGSNSELMALQVHGISFKKIVIPFLILGAFFSAFSYLLSDFVVPDFNHRASETLTRYVYKQPESTIKANQFLDVGDNRYFYVKRFDTEKGTFEDVLLYDLSQSDMRIYYAREAKKSEDTGRWKLVEGRVFTMDRQGLMKLDTVFQETEIDLTKDLDEFIRDTSKRAQDLTSKELWIKIDAYKKMGIRTNSLEVEFHTRFANALGPIIVAFLGVPLSLTFNIKSKSWSVIFTFLLIVLYQGSGAWMSALGKDGETLTPFLASWLPDIGFSVIGLILFILLDTKLMYRFKEMISRLFTLSAASKMLLILLPLFLWPVSSFSNDQTLPATETARTLNASATDT
ncbi:MAG TPA: LptF/LptG family permease, partial [Thermotogota bacterium]|nr:LptF/LptG family permease [Thermotogota bacterium]